MSWNRVYRPTQVADLHLDFVRTQIQRMMEAGKIPQTLLFAGPKGTGKTSTSRILGAIVNDPKNAKVVDAVYFKKAGPTKKLLEPDSQSEFNTKIFEGNSFVVQEMDAASNRGIDDIRQLKTRAYLPPQEGKMSVFILDEAHMLTTEAFNALLKLLEEPPEHVIFILATTALHKIPDTIVSRCQLVEFKKATEREIINRLKSILLNEKITFEDEALKLIAKNADGSFRDAVKLLELSSQSGKITQASVETFVTNSVASEVQELLKHLLNKDEIKVVELFQLLREKSVDEKYFHRSMLECIHESLLLNLGLKKGESILNKAVAQFLLQELSDSTLSESTPISHLKLELKILELIDRSKNKSGTSVKKNSEPIKTAPKIEETIKTTPIPTSPIQESQYEEAFTAQLNRENQFEDTINTSVASQYSGDAKQLFDKWQDFIEKLAVNNSTLAALLRSAKLVSNQEHSATIGVYYRFHQEQLSQKKSVQAMQECIKILFGNYIELEFIVLKAPENTELIEPQKPDSLVDSAMQALL